MDISLQPPLDSLPLHLRRELPRTKQKLKYLLQFRSQPQYYNKDWLLYVQEMDFLN